MDVDFTQQIVNSVIECKYSEEILLWYPMPHIPHGTKTKRKKENRNPSKSVKYNFYESLNKKGLPNGDMHVRFHYRKQHLQMVGTVIN